MEAVERRETGFEKEKKPMRKTTEEKKSEAWQNRIPDISRAPRKRINEGPLNILSY